MRAGCLRKAIRGRLGLFDRNVGGSGFFAMLDNGGATLTLDQTARSHYNEVRNNYSAATALRYLFALILFRVIDRFLFLTNNIL
jgi:hypothetical protein